MPKLKKIEINYDQVRELVYQLEFNKKMALINFWGRKSSKSCRVGS